MESTKRCPFCAEEIQSAASRCKHCNSDITLGDYRLERNSEVKSSSGSALVPLAAILVALLGAIGGFNWWRTGSLLGHGFTQDDITRLEEDVKAEFAKRDQLKVNDVTFIRESPTKLIGFVKLNAPLIGDISKPCSATMGDDSQIIWRCDEKVFWGGRLGMRCNRCNMSVAGPLALLQRLHTASTISGLAYSR